MISIPGISIGPQGVAGGAIEGGNDAVPARVDVFVDYMCPYCRRFEMESGPELQDLVNRGITTWEEHPLAFLDRLSQGSMYSTRSSAAAYAIAHGAPAAFGAFNAAMFRDQPKEGSEGFSEAELEQLAQKAGVPATVTRTLLDPMFLSVVQESTQLAIDAGVQGTPTVLLSSRKAGTYQWDGTLSLTDALEAMARA
jgi:protein-disulfide isomerase